MAFDNLKIVEASSMPQTEQLQISKERLLRITKLARVLFLAYPRSDYDEPDGALASYVEVLTSYSDAIIEHVTSNKTGIQRHSKFPPRVAELVAACDEIAAYLQVKHRYQNWGKNDPTLLEGPKEPKPTYDELKAKYGENWGLQPREEPRKDKFKAPTLEELQAFYARNPERISKLKGENQ